MDIDTYHHLSILNLALRLPLELHCDIFYRTGISDFRGDFQRWEYFRGVQLALKVFGSLFFQHGVFRGFLLWFSLNIITVFQIRALHSYILPSFCLCGQ